MWSCRFTPTEDPRTPRRSRANGGGRSALAIALAAEAEAKKAHARLDDHNQRLNTLDCNGAKVAELLDTIAEKFRENGQGSAAT